MDDAAFRLLLDDLNLSWKGYRKVRKGVKKRIQRHMQALACRTMPDYLALLAHDPKVRAACERNMTVSISRFFRDRGLWHALEARLLPELVDRFPGPIKVWSAGCAGGEEAYSFAIVWERLKKRFERMPAFELLATDKDEVSLARAHAGLYPRSSLKEVPPDIRSDCFDACRRDSRFRVRPYLKQGIFFESHDLLSGPPQAVFHIIFLRNNLLTYYKDNIKIQALKTIAGTLAQNGLLIIGTHERVPPGTGRLVADTRLDCVWRAAE